MAKVLVADDDPVSALVLSRALGLAGHAVTVASNGMEALEQLKSCDFDALVTDWMMPELDGLELVRKVHLRFDPAPITIMVTCLDSPQAHAHALESGADDFLTKPVNPKEVVAVLDRCLARRNQQGEDTGKFLKADATQRILAPSPAQRFPIVVIGANAGGPSALRALFRGLPPSATEAAFVIAQHLQPQMMGSFVSVLQAETSMKVAIAGDSEPILPGRILLAPGAHHAMVAPAGRRIELTSSPEENHVRPAADPLFRSAAAAFGDMCIAIVLTGMGRDGTAGCARVRAGGGTVLVARPGPRVASAMADSVIRAGLASNIVPLEEMGEIVGRTIASLAVPMARAAI